AELNKYKDQTKEGVDKLFDDQMIKVIEEKDKAIEEVKAYYDSETEKRRNIYEIRRTEFRNEISRAAKEKEKELESYISLMKIEKERTDLRRTALAEQKKKIAAAAKEQMTFTEEGTVILSEKTALGRAIRSYYGEVEGSGDYYRFGDHTKTYNSQLRKARDRNKLNRLDALAEQRAAMLFPEEYPELDSLDQALQKVDIEIGTNAYLEGIYQETKGATPREKPGEFVFIQSLEKPKAVLGEDPLRNMAIAMPPEDKINALLEESQETRSHKIKEHKSIASTIEAWNETAKLIDQKRATSAIDDAKEKRLYELSQEIIDERNLIDQSVDPLMNDESIRARLSYKEEEIRLLSIKAKAQKVEYDTQLNERLKLRSELLREIKIDRQTIAQHEEAKKKIEGSPERRRELMEKHQGKIDELNAIIAEKKIKMGMAGLEKLKITEARARKTAARLQEARLAEERLEKRLDAESGTLIAFKEVTHHTRNILGKSLEEHEEEIKIELDFIDEEAKENARIQDEIADIEGRSACNKDEVVLIDNTLNEMATAKDTPPARKLKKELETRRERLVLKIQAREVEAEPLKEEQTRLAWSESLRESALPDKRIKAAQREVINFKKVFESRLRIVEFNEAVALTALSRAKELPPNTPVEAKPYAEEKRNLTAQELELWLTELRDQMTDLIELGRKDGHEADAGIKLYDMESIREAQQKENRRRARQKELDALQERLAAISKKLNSLGEIHNHYLDKEENYLEKINQKEADLRKEQEKLKAIIEEYGENITVIAYKESNEKILKIRKELKELKFSRDTAARSATEAGESFASENVLHESMLAVSNSCKTDLVDFSPLDDVSRTLSSMRFINERIIDKISKIDETLFSRSFEPSETELYYLGRRIEFVRKDVVSFIKLKTINDEYTAKKRKTTKHLGDEYNEDEINEEKEIFPIG
ncbi:MAG: hypothetical protein JAY72_06195, partial [Candidatus Thiodiazotropha endolucinida]|nr:hypothetical protein [Candidatus Thiodiazotropha taylori]MCW4321250.1 hypothetical protein [Candidatus Thiodiazotropha taylori]